MASIVWTPIVDDCVTPSVASSERYSTRAEIAQYPLRIGGYANRMWPLTTMDLEIVPAHSDNRTPKYIDLEFLLAYSMELRK